MRPEKVKILPNFTILKWRETLNWYLEFYDKRVWRRESIKSFTQTWDASYAA